MMSRRKLGSNRCQCAVCGEYFNSTAAFDKHRTGDYGPDRRCRTPFEMTEAGMAVSQRGWWVTSLREMPGAGDADCEISAPDERQATGVA